MEQKELTENQKEQKQIKNVLELAYQKAVTLDLENLENIKLEKKQLEWISIIADNIENQTGVVTVLITSFVKKIVKPTQDIRAHKKELKGGYSGRTLDTAVVTPFMLDTFGPRFSMKESGWLSRTLEQSQAYTLNYKGKINPKVKVPFLAIQNDVQMKGGDPEKYLFVLFAKILKMKQEFDSQPTTIKKIGGQIQISKIIQLQKIFWSKAHSRAPVIAVKTLLDLLVCETKRYEEMEIPDLEAHTTSDSHSTATGDIEIINTDTQKIFESYEIKHEIKIDQRIILNVQEKIQKNPAQRYFILTTAQVIIKSEDSSKVSEVVEQIFLESGCTVMIQSLVHFLYSNLLILENPQDFITKFYENLRKDANDHGSFNKEILKLWVNLTEKLYPKSN